VKISAAVLFGGHELPRHDFVATLGNDAAAQAIMIDNRKCPAF
jgi:hypothetical protein